MMFDDMLFLLSIIYCLRVDEISQPPVINCSWIIIIRNYMNEEISLFNFDIYIYIYICCTAVGQGDSMCACHAVGPGSIPGWDKILG